MFNEQWKTCKCGQNNNNDNNNNKWTWAEPFEMNVKIEQELNFVVDNDSRLFLDAQEAKKVSERTVDR